MMPFSAAIANEFGPVVPGLLCATTSYDNSVWLGQFLGRIIPSSLQIISGGADVTISFPSLLESLSRLIKRANLTPGCNGTFSAIYVQGPYPSVVRLVDSPYHRFAFDYMVSGTNVPTGYYAIRCFEF
jgi:hypothetical protein